MARFGGRDFMKPPSQSPRMASGLSDSMHHHLNMYALAAGAAGVGVLSLTQPAEAKIVYTPTHRVIRTGHTVPIDLNHDQITDFTISNYAFSTSEIWGRTLRALPAGSGNQVVGKRGIGLVYYAYALSKGAKIGPRKPFSGKVMAASGVEYGYVGPWRNVSGRYLGLKFLIKGRVHYGWARLSVTANGSITAKLTGYAYETVANTPIIAGKTKGPDVHTMRPATLGWLALGRK